MNSSLGINYLNSFITKLEEDNKRVKALYISRFIHECILMYNAETHGFYSNNSEHSYKGYEIYVCDKLSDLEIETSAPLETSIRRV